MYFFGELLPAHKYVHKIKIRKLYTGDSYFVEDICINS